MRVAVAISPRATSPADEDRCPAGRFGDRRGPCPLQGEMLGSHERDCGRLRSRAAWPGSRVLVVTRSLTSFQATVRVRLSQQSRAGESDEPTPVTCAAERARAAMHGVHARPAPSYRAPVRRTSKPRHGQRAGMRRWRGKLSRSGRPPLAKFAARGHAAHTGRAAGRQHVRLPLSPS